MIAPSIFTRKRAAGDGQVQQFHAVILPHLDGAYNLARYLTRDATLAEDIVQDAMVRALRGFAQFRGGSARAWLLTIVRNCCRTAQASAAGRVALVVHESGLGDEAAGQLASHSDPGPTPEDDLIREGDIAMIDEPALSAKIDTGFGPQAVGLGMEFPADERRGLRRSLHQEGIVIIGDAQNRDLGHC